MNKRSATTKQIDRRRFIIKAGKWSGCALILVGLGPSAAASIIEVRPVDRRLLGPEGDYTGV
jgi:hypothetical protein